MYVIIYYYICGINLKKGVMSEFKGTKGKFEILANIIVSKNTKKAIAHIQPLDNYSKVTFKPKEDIEAKANALLISKAPELLEMLIEFNEMCDKITFPTESELKEMKNKSDLLIKQATEI